MRTKSNVRTTLILSVRTFGVVELTELCITTTLIPATIGKRRATY